MVVVGGMTLMQWLLFSSHWWACESRFVGYETAWISDHILCAESVDRQ